MPCRISQSHNGSVFSIEKKRLRNFGLAGPREDPRSLVAQGLSIAKGLLQVEQALLLLICNKVLDYCESVAIPCLPKPSPRQLSQQGVSNLTRPHTAHAAL